MKFFCRKQRLAASLLLLFTSIVMGCGEDSSPEGRMNKKLETLQQEMIDSLKQQNRAFLDSLGKIRQDLEELKALQK